jgi:hypothetical protein
MFEVFGGSVSLELYVIAVMNELPEPELIAPTSITAAVAVVGTVSTEPLNWTFSVPPAD